MSAAASLAACVGDAPPSAPSDNGNSSSSSSSGGLASSSGSSSGATSSSSSSGAIDASACLGVLCEDFEGEPTFTNWTLTVNDGQVATVDGFASLRAFGAQLAASDVTAPTGYLSAAIARTTPLPAGRFVRLDLRFWVSTCPHPLYGIVSYDLGARAVDLQWRAEGPVVRYFYEGDAGQTADTLEYPVMAANTWTPFWFEVDRVTGGLRAAVDSTERQGPHAVSLAPDAGAAFEPTLHLGAAATQPGCETRVDALRVSVRD